MFERILGCVSVVGLALTLSGCSPSSGSPSAARVVSAPPDDTAPPKRQGNIDELIAQAKKAAAAGDLAQAIDLLEQAVLIDAQHRTVLLLLAQYAQTHSKSLIESEPARSYQTMGKAAGYLGMLRNAHSNFSDEEKQMFAELLYDEAASHARSGRLEETTGSLNQAVAAGFLDLDRLDANHDFDYLRTLAEFQKLREGLTAAVAARARQMAEELFAQHEPFEFQFTLPNLAGKQVSLADHRGRVVIVALWGTWCQASLEQLASLQALHQKHRDSEVIGINYEHLPADQIGKRIEAVTTERGLTFSCVPGDEATLKQVPALATFPTTLFVDRQGRVRLRLTGRQPLERLDAVASTLLAETAGAGTQ